MNYKVKDFVTQEHVVTFDSYRAGFFYYNVYNVNQTDKANFPERQVHQFTVPVEDIGQATMMHTDKAITFMRWIRKAIDGGTFVKVN